MSISFIILTGGSSSRFGADKSQIALNGLTLINRLLTDLPEGVVVIVGPSFEQNVREVEFTVEHPLGGGPVAGIEAGLRKITSEQVFILATDMPFAAEFVPHLLPRSADWEAVIPLDADGKRQPLCGRYRTEALVRALQKIGITTGKSMRLLLENLIVEEFKFESRLTSKLVDIDTRADLTKVLTNLTGEIEEK